MTLFYYPKDKSLCYNLWSRIKKAFLAIVLGIWGYSLFQRKYQDDLELKSLKSLYKIPKHDVDSERWSAFTPYLREDLQKKRFSIFC